MIQRCIAIKNAIQQWILIRNAAPQFCHSAIIRWDPTVDRVCYNNPIVDRVCYNLGGNSTWHFSSLSPLNRANQTQPSFKTTILLPSIQILKVIIVLRHWIHIYTILLIFPCLLLQMLPPLLTLVDTLIVWAPQTHYHSSYFLSFLSRICLTIYSYTGSQSNKN